MEGDSEFQIKVERNPESFVRVHSDFRAILHPSSRNQIMYTLGPHEGHVPVQYDPAMDSDTVYLSSAFAHHLGIRRFTQELRAILREDRMQLGHFLGILCSPRWNEKTQTMRPTKHLPVLQKLLTLADSETGVAFIFDIRDVNFAAMKVKGYRYINQQWVVEQFPLPNVVYDQVISRKRERDTVYAKRHKRLATLYQDKLFNAGFLDKWQVYKWLQEDKRTEKFIPDTARYTTVSEAVKFIGKHPVTFCKPVHGSLGLGIFRIERLVEGGYMYQIRRRTGAPTQSTAPSAVEAVNQLKKRLAAKPYVLQQGITLAQWDGRPFDIRIVMQRDEQGEWKRTKMFARLAEKGQITSNLSTGGEAASLESILNPLFHEKSKQRRVIQMVRRISRIVPDVMEEQSSRRYGELGIDIGLDPQGGVWIIEVNSKPWKTTLTEKGRQDLVDLAFLRPVRYARYLSRLTDSIQTPGKEL
ncbi:YheC/YheD family protein [Alicyclobacillus sp. SO9]|uniref:YheC/YheD family endospore coat-associated protein n=1 Tax=Alicyclobacillus sp. SO9 TaxID=2665646 RepID=UPI0018E822C3|nr:YheC/YheD family protein [Alicyclobacillus sp. SO9]QQE80950.1 YheC/YheD family protein [Alicyclobacillus sp. SO9]